MIGLHSNIETFVRGGCLNWVFKKSDGNYVMLKTFIEVFIRGRQKAEEGRAADVNQESHLTTAGLCRSHLHRLHGSEDAVSGGHAHHLLWRTSRDSCF